jgi:hypothetical protein
MGFESTYFQTGLYAVMIFEMILTRFIYGVKRVEVVIVLVVAVAAT